MWQMLPDKAQRFLSETKQEEKANIKAVMRT